MYKAQKVQKYALNSQLQALQILKNDDEVENWRLSSFLLAVQKKIFNTTYPHKIVQINYTSWADLFIVVPYL